jgi:hypothetical protein
VRRLLRSVSFHLFFHAAIQLSRSLFIIALRSDPDVWCVLSYHSGVQPFCLSDNTDGFWSQCVQEPWDHRDPSGRTARSLAFLLQEADVAVAGKAMIDVLLESVMIRHSKAQTTLATGESILKLPEATVQYVGIDGGPGKPFLRSLL